MNIVMIHYVICQLICVTDPWTHTSFVHSILSLKLGVTVLTDKPEVGRTDAALLVEERERERVLFFLYSLLVWCLHCTVTPNFKDKIECTKLMCAQESVTHIS